MNPITLPYLAAARAFGAEAGAFLQAQLTADVAALADNDATFAGYCSPRGRVFGLLLVWRRGEEFLLVGADALLPDMLRRLQRYVLRARVTLEMSPGLSVQGLPAARGGPSRKDAACPAETGLCYSLAPAAPGESNASAVSAWKERELRRLIAWLAPETSERFIPQMLGYETLSAVSFSKGCYPGQEIVARARYLGRVKRGPLLLSIPDAPQAAPGKALRLSAGGESQDAVLIDSVAGTGGDSLWLVVTPEPRGGVEGIEYEERRYGCATI